MSDISDLDGNDAVIIESKILVATYTGLWYE